MPTPKGILETKFDNYFAKPNAENGVSSPPQWRPAVVTNAVSAAQDSNGRASISVESAAEERHVELEPSNRRSFGVHLKQTSEPSYNRQSSEPIMELKNQNKIRGKILPDRIPLDAMKSTFLPTTPSPTASPNLSGVPPWIPDLSKHDLNASDRKNSGAFLNGNPAPLSAAPPHQNPKEEASKKSSHDSSNVNGHKPPFPLSSSSENTRIQELKASDAAVNKKRHSRNLDSSATSVEQTTDLDRSSTPVRRHQNDPTPELPRKVSAPVQVTTKLEVRKTSEVTPRPTSAAANKDLKQHPISRQNVRPTASLSSNSVASINDRPLPAQPQKTAASQSPALMSSSSNVSTPSSKAAASSQVAQPRRRGEAENTPRAVWDRPAKSVLPVYANESASSGVAIPMKLENIEQSPGARRKSHAMRHEEMQLKPDSSTGGYAQLRLEGAVTESSSTEAPEHVRTSSNQPGFPYVDSDSDATLAKPSTVRKNNYSFEDSFTSCFNSSYANVEEERRKASKPHPSEHAVASNMPSSGSFANSTPSSHRNNEGDQRPRHGPTPTPSNSQQNAPYREPVKHWHRNSVPSSSFVNSDYGNGRSTPESSAQQQVLSRGAVINPDYGTNLNAVSNDQYGVGATSLHEANSRRFADSNASHSQHAISNSAYDVPANTHSHFSDSDYESLVNASSKDFNSVYSNQLESVPEVKQRRRKSAVYEHEDVPRVSDSAAFDDSGVHMLTGAAESQGSGAYERLYQPPVPLPSSNGAKDAPKAMPRVVSLSREKLPVPGDGDISRVTTKVSVVKARSITPSASQENLQKLSLDNNPRSVHCSVVSSSFVTAHSCLLTTKISC